MSDLNVGTSERWLSSLVGGMLALAGLERRSAGGAIVAGLGGFLIVRGITGYCPGLERMGVSTLGYAEALQYDHDESMVDESSDASFPASDAPSWTATTSVGSPHQGEH